jgi:hypothetical protein
LKRGGEEGRVKAMKGLVGVRWRPVD